MLVYSKYIKRGLDIVLSLAAIVILSVPMFIVIIITHIDSDGSAIFVQRRSGLHRKPFSILKFRSMSIQMHPATPTSSMEDVVLTKWQSWMRKNSVDELPQLFNILRGDMSLVGPRPVLCEETDLLDERDRYGANDVKPGLTGWAQINGRDELDYHTKAMLDGEYANNISFLFDMRCLLSTFDKVIKKHNIKH